MKVLKFGGTSMATPQSILTAVEIIKSEKADVIVVSAPGKRNKNDTKITDLLFDCYTARLQSGKCDVPFLRVKQRIIELSHGVGVTDISPYLDQIRHDINCGESIGYTVSRGEFLCALIMRHLLSCEFIDAKELIKFDIEGNLDQALSFYKISKRLKGALRVVIPGYYGALPNGEIKTFTRGGSDVSAAIIAAGAQASEYQNWTDVDGVYFCPIVDKCSTVDTLSYRNMRELAFLGAEVLHPDSLVPLMQRNIEVKIKNSFNTKAIGTLITSEQKAYELLMKNDKKNPNQLKDKGLNTLCNEKNAGNLPITLSGRAGFKMLTFYVPGSCCSDYLNQLIYRCIKQGAKVFTTLCSVDSYNIILSGEVGNVLECTSVQNIAIITILNGEKSEVIQEICKIDGSPLFLQVSQGNLGIILGVEEEKLNYWLNQLCQLIFTQSE